MARLVSVNVGLPRDIAWNGRTVHTGVWKDAVRGRCDVRRLNLRGDGQGDLAGHGGEQRAVLVYQMDSYRHWEHELGRSGFTFGQFGENFTIDGLPDDVVCIGDRYRIGSALFEVTQPRVTCYRVGIRMNETRMPALLTSSGRPGFYLRVLQEGDVGAADEILKVGEAKERMTVAEVNALLYLPRHEPKQLERALRIEALSPGWRASLTSLARSGPANAGIGNAGLTPMAATRPVAPGFRRMAISAVEQASYDVLSLTMRRQDDHALEMPLPGQYVVLRLPRPAGGTTLFRSYSLSGAPSEACYRISVKVEPNGAAGNYLEQHAHVHDVLDVSLPRGTFTLRAGDRPVVLLSAGIGVTPVLAMLHALAAAREPRRVWWLYGTRDGQHHPFAAEVRELLRALPNARSRVCYSDPGRDDKVGEDFDVAGRLSRSVFAEVGLPPESEVYLCGPAGFMAEMRDALSKSGVAPERIRSEIFSGGESMTPGVVSAPPQPPHAPSADAGAGPLISFARSGIAAHWDPSAYQNLLELAEACDVPVRWSCRAGVCHNCESGLISGAVSYQPDPLDAPADGNILLCCARPRDDVVIDI